MLLILSSQSVLLRNPFFFKKLTGFGTENQSFQALIWPWDLWRSTTANDNTSLLDKLFLIFNISTWLKYLSIFFSSLFLKKKQFIWIRKWPLADVFLLVLSQFRLSHIRPLGAIYSLIGFCMCSAQTFLTGGHLIIMDRHHGNYGTHTPHMWNRCYRLLHHQTSWSSEQTSRKNNINNLNDLHVWR